MLVGVISDTHDNLPNIEKAIKVLNEKKVDLVIHCGDYVAPFVIKKLSELKARLVGVFGNNDGDKKLLLDFANKYGFEIHNAPLEYKLDGLNALILHGFSGMNVTLKIVESIAAKGIYDVIFYGHTHKKDYRIINNTIVINPGEVFGMLTGKATIVIFDTSTKKVEFIEL